jgi:hypothetical protein
MSWRSLSIITIMKKKLVLLEANIYVFYRTGRIWPVPHKAFLGTSSTRCMMLV